MRPSRPEYDTPVHGVEVFLFFIVVALFGVGVGLYDLDHRMSQDTCRALGILSCSHIVVQERSLMPPERVARLTPALDR